MIEYKDNNDSLALCCILQQSNLQNQMWLQSQSGSADAFSLEVGQQSSAHHAAGRHSL